MLIIIERNVNKKNTNPIPKFTICILKFTIFFKKEVSRKIINMKDITILTPHTRVHTHTHSLTYIKLLFSLPTENVLYSDSTINIVVWPVECYKSGLLLIK